MSTSTPPHVRGARRSLARQAKGRKGPLIAGGALLLAALAAAPGLASASTLGERQLHHYRGTTTTSTVGVPTGATLPAPEPPPPAPRDTCAKGLWPAVVQGLPVSYIVGQDGAYLWYDPDGAWALRFTHSGTHFKAAFSGSLTVGSGELVDVSAMGGGNDIVAVSPDKRTIYFRFANFGPVDGLNFATQCTRGFSVDIHRGPRLMAPAAIHLGASLTSPARDPVRVARSRPNRSRRTKVAAR